MLFSAQVDPLKYPAVQHDMYHPPLSFLSSPLKVAAHTCLPDAAPDARLLAVYNSTGGVAWRGAGRSNRKKPPTIFGLLRGCWRLAVRRCLPARQPRLSGRASGRAVAGGIRDRRCVPYSRCAAARCVVPRKSLPGQTDSPHPPAVYSISPAKGTAERKPRNSAKSPYCPSRETHGLVCGIQRHTRHKKTRGHYNEGEARGGSPNF